MEYLRNVTSLSLDPSLCNGCGMCAVVCPHGVLFLSRGKCVIRNRDACMECGACAVNCPPGAMKVNPGVGCAAARLHSMVGLKGVCNCDCTSPCESSMEAPPSG